MTGRSLTGVRSVATVGVVGAGSMARVHAEVWRSLGVRVAAFSRSGTAALLQPGETDAETLDELVASTDLIDVCSPTASHADVVRAAIEGGLPVVCEKPLALTSSDADSLVFLARDRGVPLLPAHVLRYFPAYDAAKRALDAGRLGQPAVGRFVRMGEYPTWASWLDDDAQSGGIILDQMIHDLDMAAWMFGPVSTVHAVERRVVNARSAHVVLRHESGAVSQATGVWGTQGLAFATRFRVAGSTGVLEHDSRRAGSFLRDDGRADAADVESTRPVGDGSAPYADQLADALAAVQQGGVTRTSAEEGAEAVRIARAAIDSVATGTTIELDRGPR